jgi:hypothetical protein
MLPMGGIKKIIPQIPVTSVTGPYLIIDFMAEVQIMP